jgi:hypothetical protein
VRTGCLWTAAYDEATHAWEARPIQGFVNQAAIAAAVDPTSGHVYVYAGGTSGGNPNATHINRLELYDQPDARGYWGRQVVLTPGGPRPTRQIINIQNQMVWVPSLRRFFLLAGRDRATYGAWLYDPAANAWTDLKPTAVGGVFPPMRENAAVAWQPVDQVVLLHGGRNLGDLWAWFPRENRWQDLTATLGVPTQLAAHHTLLTDGARALWLLPATQDNRAYRLTLNLGPSLPPQTLRRTVVAQGTTVPSDGGLRSPDGTAFARMGTPVPGWTDSVGCCPGCGGWLRCRR